MSPGSVELDGCMGARGFGPATIGGVTSWARSLARELPALRIGMHAVGDELPPARCYHALMPAALPAARTAARVGRRPVVLTVHAMAEPWEPAGWRARIDPQDVSHGGGRGGNQRGNGQNAWIDRTYDDADRIVALGDAVGRNPPGGPGPRHLQ